MLAIGVMIEVCMIGIISSIVETREGFVEKIAFDYIYI